MARTPRRNRIALILFVIAAAGTCLALGWWQWTRFQSSGGTFQNLGYALQWPLFAAFFVYGYRRFVQLEGEEAAIDNGDVADASHGPAEPPRRRRAERADSELPAARPTIEGATEIPEGFLPQRPRPRIQAADPHDPSDRVRAEYNEELARLAARDSGRNN